VFKKALLVDSGRLFLFKKAFLVGIFDRKPFCRKDELEQKGRFSSTRKAFLNKRD